MRLLIIEDEKNLAELLASILKKAGFAVDIANDGERGSFMARTQAYDLIITDYVLPKLDGGSVIKEIRSDGRKVPIIMLSVRQSTVDKVNVLNSGADDYLAKPFSTEELLARIKALLRRPPLISDEKLKFHDLEMEPASFKVRRGKTNINLTNKEFSLLQHLLINAGRIVTRESLLEHVWNGDVDPFSNTVETHILRLRRKVDAQNPKLIHSIVGRGYKLDLKA